LHFFATSAVIADAPFGGNVTADTKRAKRMPLNFHPGRMVHVSCRAVVNAAAAAVLQRC
jgi:hypothetical protein